jgi:hypothetical protein
VTRSTVLAVALLGLAGAPATSHAATCADYPDQASAQRAGDTRDADGDGVYCESNPCPCLKPGGGSGGSTPAPRPQPRPRPKPHRKAPLPAESQMGGSRQLHPRTKSSGCQLNGALPDPACTPGAVFRKATRKLVCRSGYSSKVRHVTSSTRNSVFAEYGITSHAPDQYEVDHLVPLELGGSNAISNLFPQPAVPDPPGMGFHDKDRLENSMHRDVCSQLYGLGEAQKAIAVNWVTAFGDYLGD